MLLIFVAMPGGSIAAVGDPADALDKALAREKMTGIAWSMVDGDRIVVGARGLGDGPAGRALRSDDRVHVGSIAKTIVALGVLRLVSEGRIALDQPVEQLLPGVIFDNRWRATSPVTVRHLLDHSAGLEDARLWHIFSAQTGANDPLAGLIARDPSILNIRTRPGQIFSYSNVGYTLLGMIIERATRTPYEQWLDSNILLPIGMGDSTATFQTQQGAARDARLVWGHQDRGDRVAAMPVAVRPAGQLTTTPRDMARLAQYLMGDGRVGGAQIIRPDLLSAMARPRHAAARAGLVHGYALGLGLFDRGGHAGRCHGGDIVGFRAMLCLYPEEKKAYFRSINIDKEGADYRQFDRILIASLYLPATSPSKAAPLADTYRGWGGRYVPLVSRVAIGRYPELLSDGIDVALSRSGATITHDDGKIVQLVAAGRNLLRDKDKVRPSHVLHPDPGGGQLISTDFRTYRRAHWAERPALLIGLFAGVGGLAYLLLVAPIVAWRAKRPIISPILIIFAICPVVVALLYVQPFQQLGDLTTGSALLALVTAALPIALVWQAVTAARSRHAGRRIELLATAAALQWVGTFAAFGLVPLFLWK
ncbi:serine hydrolase domain-containing protein [Sphingopyxis sp.]|uniref:serine hydrolase domain-containing protein n=1 Tax=Sphingopyxis sp. TaxID=1908224 RepID=UPI003D0F4ABB